MRESQDLACAGAFDRIRDVMDSGTVSGVPQVTSRRDTAGTMRAVKRVSLATYHTRSDAKDFSPV